MSVQVPSQEKMEHCAPHNVVRTKEPRLTQKTSRRHEGGREVAKINWTEASLRMRGNGWTFAGRQ